MTPITLARIGEENIIKKVGGEADVKKHLESLGILVGSRATIIATHEGDVIISIKEARIAVNEDMAKQIMI